LTVSAQPLLFQPKTASGSLSLVMEVSNLWVGKSVTIEIEMVSLLKQSESSL